MKRVSFMWRALILSAAAAALAAGLALAAPPATKKSFTFDVGSAFGDSDNFSFTVTAAGCILAQVRPWAASTSGGTPASQLSLSLVGSDRSTYSQANGAASSVLPLWISFAASSSDVSKVKSWTISIGNFTRSGTARGTIDLEYPSTQAPCELKAAVSRTRGRVDLSWRYTAKAFKGSFFVERSTDGRTWGVVRACTKSPTSVSYSCFDTNLRSGTRYYFRACAVTLGAKCGTTNVTPAVSVKLP